MKQKIRIRGILYLIAIWFALQALFMFYWPIYLNLETGYEFPEMLIVGGIVFVPSLLIIIRNNTIQKIAKFVLWIYSICLAFLELFTIFDPIPYGWLGIILAGIMIVNIALLILEYFHDIPPFSNLKIMQ